MENGRTGLHFPPGYQSAVPKEGRLNHRDEVKTGNSRGLQGEMCWSNRPASAVSCDSWCATPAQDLAMSPTQNLCLHPHLTVCWGLCPPQIWSDWSFISMSTDTSSLGPCLKITAPRRKTHIWNHREIFLSFFLIFSCFFFTFSYFPLSFSPFNFFHLIFALCVISFFHFALLTFCFSSHFLLPLPNSTNTFILPNRIFFTTSLALLSYRSV